MAERGGTRLKFAKDDTAMLLRLYLGAETGRSVKKKDLHDELVRRGVSTISVMMAIDSVCHAIGWAADNRVPEIDDNQGEES